MMASQSRETGSSWVTPRRIYGTQPGLLDPSQRSRLLRFPDSKLFFASFDPRTAFVDGWKPHARNVDSSDGLPPPKRIVMETSSSGTCFWRFVPRARLEEDVKDEGSWPRLIHISGEPIYCYQEQWDIYKLDPAYRCAVYPPPKLSSITAVDLQSRNSPSYDSFGPKRSRMSSPEYNASVPQKKARSCHPPCDSPDAFVSTASDSEEDQVEEMAIDGNWSSSTPKHPSDWNPSRKCRERQKAQRQQRWEWNRRLEQKYGQEQSISAEASFSMQVDQEGEVTYSHVTRPATYPAEQKDDPSATSQDNMEESENRTIPDTRKTKRARTESSDCHSDYRKTMRERKRLQKLERLRQRHPGWNHVIDTQQAEFIPADVISLPEDPWAESQGSPRTTTDTMLDSEIAREAAIAESVRKIRELEKERPLWEEMRKKREARERAEEEHRRAKREERRRAEERKMREREGAEQEARQAQEVAAQKRACEEESRRRAALKQRQRERWNLGPWTPARALERYRMLSEEFDSWKFPSQTPITFDDIPWPVLHTPSCITVEDVDWSAVETFFDTVQPHMRPQDYKCFVERSHRRFHPDRWRARKVWSAVIDEVERGFMEVAANTVSQAITPIWRSLRGV